MSTDRELLELAAKAAGLKIHAGHQADRDAHIDPAKASLWVVDVSTAWNPLTDDGDALRLAVGLRLDMTFTGGRVETYWTDPVERETRWAFEGINDAQGEREATRRAIVRAAAEIGKAMP